MNREKYNVVFKSFQQLTPNVRHLSFAREDGQKLDYIPGQFITFHFEVDDKVYRRSYSIASIPGQSDDIEIALSYVKDGVGSNLLFGLQPGDTLETTGPFGRLVLKDEAPKRYILMATGTGITPFRTMMPELGNRLKMTDSEVHIMLGVQKREDLLYNDEFVAFANAHPRCHFYACLSREQEAANEFERIGHVQVPLQTLQPNHETDVIYLCGNPNMIDDVFALLKEIEFEPKQVRREKYIS